MIQHEIQIRVRYAETDPMGVVYHANYVHYFDLSRTELIRHLGYPYQEMEAEGTFMPVSGMRVRYLRSARYDDVLTLRATIRRKPEKRITIETQVINESGKLMVEGIVTLAFVDAKSGKSIPAPVKFTQILDQNWAAKAT